MSNLVYPELPGLGFGVIRAQVWRNSVRETDSGREFSRAIWSSPRRRYRLKYEFLRSGQAFPEMQTLLAFFNAHQGSFDTWRFRDPDDHEVADEPLGTGNGTRVAWQAIREFAGLVEPVYELDGTPVVKINGVATTAFTVSATGLITFSAPPANGADITWTGDYFWRCRFTKDQMDLEKFMQDMWQLGQVEFMTVKP
jgi:uncharacterized protein (TIGR02217 family)